MNRGTWLLLIAGGVLMLTALSLMGYAQYRTIQIQQHIEDIVRTHR